VLTRLLVRNFRRLEEADIGLDAVTMLAGPNDSGKTAALQALCLWALGLRRWRERRSGHAAPGKRLGAPVNRRDLIAVPLPHTDLLWHDLRLRDTSRATQNVLIEVMVSGATRGVLWECGLEFDYANEELFYVRPLRLGGGRGAERMEVPDEASDVRVALLPPMAGLAAVEPRWEPGRTNVLIGEGQTAQVLRNLCYQVSQAGEGLWDRLAAHVRDLFGVELLRPRHLPERGEITMQYRQGRTVFDLSSSGSGMLQTVLLLSYLYSNPGAVLLVDEPDAHLEVLRQRQTLDVLVEAARANEVQLIIATHSAALLEEAVGRHHVVVLAEGHPSSLEDQGPRVMEALPHVGCGQYLLARWTGWVLYLETPRALTILRAFARRLGHRALSALERPFVRYVGAEPEQAIGHFRRLQCVLPGLIGVGLFATPGRDLPSTGDGLRTLQWTRAEAECYLCTEAALVAWARGAQRDLFGEHRAEAMGEAIRETLSVLRALGKSDPFGGRLRVSEEFLPPVFDAYRRLTGGEGRTLSKATYPELVEFLPQGAIDPEVVEKLDAIAQVADGARPPR